VIACVTCTVTGASKARRDADGKVHTRSALLWPAPTHARAQDTHAGEQSSGSARSTPTKVASPTNKSATASTPSNKSGTPTKTPSKTATAASPARNTPTKKALAAAKAAKAHAAPAATDAESATTTTTMTTASTSNAAHASTSTAATADAPSASAAAHATAPPTTSSALAPTVPAPIGSLVDMPAAVTPTPPAVPAATRSADLFGDFASLAPAPVTATTASAATTAPSTDAKEPLDDLLSFWIKLKKSRCAEIKQNMDWSRREADSRQLDDELFNWIKLCHHAAVEEVLRRGILNLRIARWTYSPKCRILARTRLRWPRLRRSQ
jgi:hypothetical protein